MNEIAGLGASPSGTPLPDTHLNSRKNYLIAAAIVIVFLGAGLVYAYVTGRLDAVLSSQTASCTEVESPRDTADREKLAELEAKISAISGAKPEELDPEATDAEADAYFERQSNKYAIIEELETEFNDIHADLAKRQFTSISGAALSSIHETYCGTEDSFVGADLFKEEYDEVTQQMSAADARELVCKLEGNMYVDAHVPFALHNLGQKAAMAGQFDAAVQLYRCAAEKYYDTISMYRMAQVHALGSAAFKDEGSSFETVIPQDLKRAYFWIAALVHTDLMQSYGFLDSSTQFGWNAISLLDSLQNDETLTDQDLLMIEDDALSFVTARYPAAVENRQGVYNHSMRAMIPALEKAAGLEAYELNE